MFATTPASLLRDWSPHQTSLNPAWENNGMEQPVYDAGVAGSVTMIFLTLATVILMRSFYKRWKRMDARRTNDESK